MSWPDGLMTRKDTNILFKMPMCAEFVARRRAAELVGGKPHEDRGKIVPRQGETCKWVREKYIQNFCF